MSDGCDPIIEAGDDGEVLDATKDGGPTVCCPNSHEFARDEATAATFDGSTAVYRCPECGHATEGPPPDGR